MYLYLIESVDYFKIGITENYFKRFKQYLSYNPNVQLIALIKGDETDIQRLEYAIITARKQLGFIHIFDWFKKDCKNIFTQSCDMISKIENIILFKKPIHLIEILSNNLSIEYLKQISNE